MLGMMDDNLDGKLEKSELKGGIGAQLLKYFDVLDKNHDGVLDADELAAAQAMMGPRRRAAGAIAPAAAPAPAAPAGPAGK
jgi:Ca2+-binding EF-hand superfamily protein